MFTNYFKTAFRNLLKRKGYSILNILGLTIGMLGCLLIFHYVSYEKSYDSFQPKSKNIVRLRLDNYQKGELSFKSATVYPGIAPAMKRDFPEVEDFCRLHDAEWLLTNPKTNVKFSEKKGYFADASAVSMLDIDLVQGNGKTVLDAPDKMIISESIARKYFGNGNPVGETLQARDPQGVQTYQITGVFKDYPHNSHLVIDYLVSYPTLQKIINSAWGDTTNATETSFGWYDFYTYIQLKEGASLQQFASKVPAFTDKYINSQEWYQNNNNRGEIHLLPITDIHLKSNYNQEAEVNGNGQAIGFLFLVGLFIIGIAWVNYINLATARSVERAKEVGVRKVMGALRSELIKQFMTESFLMNIIAFVLSLLFFFMLVNPFDRFTGRDVLTGMTLSNDYWILFGILFLGGTLLSGLYPAFVLSSFQPIRVLKGVFKNSSGGAAMRKGLIVVQFIISVVLIAGTIIVYQQVNFMRTQQLGANISQTLVLKGAESVSDSLYGNTFQPFKQELLQNPNVRNVAISSSIMGNEIYWTSGITRLNHPGATSVTLYHLGVDHDFVPAYELKMLSGRNFSKEFSTDEKAVLINEKAAQSLGFRQPQEAVNALIQRGRDSLKIVGVVSNFHHMGLQKAIDPMIFLLRPNLRQYYSIKVTGENVSSTIASVEKTWNKYFPNDPFNHYFLDESFQEQYKADLLFGKVFGTFALLAILIACFGLLGLSAYNVLQRTKEIGIRKVLGADSNNLFALLSKDFMKLIIVALVVAIPIGWYIMNHWLQEYAFRINVEWWVFALAGGLALLIAFVTIAVQIMKAIVENPVKSLRSE
jgi:putative ABC transport system permease protein